MSFTSSASGLFVVTYRTAAELLPEAQTPLVSALRLAVERGRVGIIFDVGDAITSVDLSVPSFWLDVTSRLQLSAMSIVTRSIGVRVAARGFKLAQFARKHPIEVEVHETVDDALTWMRARLDVVAATG
ncbi:MAG: hypothetical protein SFW67_24360 [Myxococcaceae bacterium]|nr:hypothetical protein [Myxococcaceae bacterium]